MSATQVEGTIRNVAGKAEEAVGSMTGDSNTELRGKARQVAGQAQSAMGDAMETVRDIATDQPLMAVLLAAGVGLIAGMLIARR
jgi:uncharacterized protein YjbJ (UPF0337 family)